MARWTPPNSGSPGTDTEEATGSNPVGPTRSGPHPGLSERPILESALCDLPPREPEEQLLAMPGCSHPECASGVEEAHEVVTLGQVLHLLGVDPHQRANLFAENGTYDTKPLGDEVGPDAQPHELITGPDA